MRRAEAKKSRRDLIRTGAGRSLVGQGATGIFHCQENLERARRENSPSTALIDSSVLAMAYTLSARISPKKPARIRVETTRPVETEQFTIAPYTAFSSDPFALFNRRAITFEAEEFETPDFEEPPANVPISAIDAGGSLAPAEVVSAVLHEGRVVEQ